MKWFVQKLTGRQLLTSSQRKILVPGSDWTCCPPPVRARRVSLASLVEGVKFRVHDFGFWVSGYGFRVSGFGFQVSGFGFRVQGLGVSVSGFGLKASGCGSRV